MATTAGVSNTISIEDKYNTLVKQSLGGDSVYIRAKETIQELVTDGALDDAQKAEVISSILGGAVNSISGTCMSTALEWAKFEKEIELKKLELDLQLAILEHEVALKEAQVDQVEIQNRLALVESRRMYGIGTFDVTTGALLGLTDEGKVWNDMLLVTQNTTNAGVEETLLTSKIRESEVAIHKVVADTYVNYGSYTFAHSPSGVTSVVPTHGAHVTLSQTQKDIAIEQGKGYAYNAWANALTGSASMLGTAIASDYFDFSNGSTGDVLLSTVLSCAEGLQKATTTTAEAIPEVV